MADDRVLATVLFTDIVDSTRRAAEMGDRDWHALLDAHDAVLRSQLARFRGREVNTSGDGFLATFDGPQRAIRCAMAIRDAVQALGIQIRAGLHTGEVELQNAGISGYTAEQVLTDEVPQIEEFQPTLITFQAGGNDIVNGVTLDQYRQNVKAVLEAATGSGARVIVLAQNEWFRSPEGKTYGDDLAAQREAFDAALIEEANAAGAEFVDMRATYKQQADDNQWVEDGIHPTPDAYAAWATELAGAVPAPCQ
jgi:lysophospholipase L1-like esterase